MRDSRNAGANRTRGRWAAWGIVLVATLLSGACQRDTAIVISIHAGDATAAGAFQLDVYVGVGQLDAPTRPGPPAIWWHRAPVEFDADVLTLADPLGDGTFQLALSPSADLPLADAVAVAVFARAAGEDSPQAFGHVGPLRFGDGEVRTVALELRDLEDRVTAGVTSTGCAWWAADDDPSSAGAVRDRAIVPLGDADCDGYRVAAPGEVTDCRDAVDCADADPAIHPGASETCTSGELDCCSATGPDADADGDGYTVCDGDCLDSGVARGRQGGMPVQVAAADIHPGADDDTCDGVDQNCSGTCDDHLDNDEDQDGFVACGTVTTVDQPNQPGTGGAVECAPTQAVLDCDDHDQFGVPGAGRAEACDGLDFDCDGTAYVGEVACLVDVDTSCVFGLAPCQEAGFNGQPQAGACVPLATAPPAPDAACNSCNGVDPLDCPDGPLTACGVWGEPAPASPSEPCATPAQVIPLGACAGGCTWRIAGGVTQRGWVVSLNPSPTPDPGPPRATLIDAEAYLEVRRLGTMPTGVSVLKGVPITEVVHRVLVPKHDQTCGTPTCM